MILGLLSALGSPIEPVIVHGSNMTEDINVAFKHWHIHLYLIVKDLIVQCRTQLLCVWHIEDLCPAFWSIDISDYII